MVEQRSFIRSAANANRVAQLGMLRGAGIGAVLTLPVAGALMLLGAWLDAPSADPSLGWILGTTVLVTGGFVGAFWTAQSDLMAGWPKNCRTRVWAEWRRAVALFVAIGLPFAALVGWLAWRDEGSCSLALALGVEVCWPFAGVGSLVGYYRGGRNVQHFLDEAGYVPFGWFRHGAPTEAPDEDITDRLKQPQDIRARRNGGQAR